MKRKYTIAIEESFVKEFEVFAESEEEAFNLIEENYRKGKFVLEYNEVSFKQYAMTNPIVSEWSEF